MRRKNHSMNDALQIGEKIQVALDEKSVYPTLVEDITENERIIISVPIYRGIPVPMNVGQQVQIIFFRDNGRFLIKTQVERILLHNSLHLIQLLQLSRPIKQQRRNSFRLPVNLEAHIRLYGDGTFPPKPVYKEEDMPPWEQASTYNISEGGVAINSRNPYELGQCIHLRIILSFPEQPEQIEMLGVVRQSDIIEINEMQLHRLGIEFLPYESSLRRRISKFILRRQQDMLKMRSDQYNDF